MKIIIIAFIVFVSSSLQAQVAIGKQSVTNTSVSLEFAAENRGLILPYVETKGGISAEGTMIFDTTDHKVKYLKNGGTWVNLSEDNGTVSTIGVADLSIQQGTEQLTAKTAIGATSATDTTPGILVLTATDKAMILPKVASPHLNIINPASGMIVYDTVKRQLAVYNGKVWSFWKP
ncbi:hypothetical protein [Frigoriflavimonas asaccharolytica]|uniref:Aspartyl protease n=1 Tax=Frigoriflavimonas asaccharolytica TaxID=2735899 RepID=A0A8J8GA59_9FLAO|nr:hypothetical protein [Frigoriflavimonas asaccharolytica]NRS94046.1 hypothetical protein [Frigoriflavimonas asaccharolytica]